MTNRSGGGTPMEATEVIETMALAAASRENLIEICKTLRRQKFKLQDELSAAQSALAEKERELENERMKVAGGSTAAIGYWRNVAAEARAREVEKDTLEKCAKVLEALPMDKPRCRILNLPEQAWEEAQDQCINAIRALAAPPASPTGRKDA